VRVRYDEESDAAYIALAKIGVGGVDWTLPVTDAINLDFDRAGKLVGIEVLAAQELLRDETLRFANRNAKPS
jgi:uncharacterized protein YuzE